MFDVVLEGTGSIYTVYKVVKEGESTKFLIYDFLGYGRWDWVEANYFAPCIEEEEA